MLLGWKHDFFVRSLSFPGLGYGRAADRLLRSEAEQWSAQTRNPGTTDGAVQ